MPPFIREATVIGGEESGGTAVAAITAPIGALCTVGAAFCVGGAAIVGDFAGSELGGYLAGKGFDEAAELTEEQRMAIMNYAESTSKSITTEDREGPVNEGQ